MVFIIITVRVSLNLSYFNNLFRLRNNGELDVNVFIIARGNSCPGRTPADVLYTDAGRRPYDM